MNIERTGKRISRKRKDDGIFAFCMCIGSCLLYITFFILPTLQSFKVSTYDWSGFNTDKMKSIGLENFRRLSTDQVFLNAIKNNIKLIIFGGLLVAVLGLLFALVLSDDETKIGAFLRGMVFFPYSVSIVAIGIAWTFIFNPQFGLLNTILVKIGLKSFQNYAWLGNENISFFCMIFVTVWVWVGYFMITIIAGIKRIPEDYLEAAKIDGATDWQITWRIKIPLLRDVLGICVLYWIINGWMSFGVVYVMTEGGPNNINHTIATYMMWEALSYRNGVYKMGYGTAIAVVMAIIVMAFGVLYQIWLSRTEDVTY